MRFGSRKMMRLRLQDFKKRFCSYIPFLDWHNSKWNFNEAIYWYWKTACKKSIGSRFVVLLLLARHNEKGHCHENSVSNNLVPLRMDICTFFLILHEKNMISKVHFITIYKVNFCGQQYIVLAHAREMDGPFAHFFKPFLWWPLWRRVRATYYIGGPGGAKNAWKWCFTVSSAIRIPTQVVPREGVAWAFIISCS
jgi:hypothetical protein